MAALLLAGPAAADRIDVSLTGRPGDPAQGRAIVANRQLGLCLLCHAGPFPEERFQGSIGPNLAGIGARLDEGQIRLRVANARSLDPNNPMPNYLQTESKHRVATSLRDRPILTPAQIEDVVAFLTTLRTP